MLLNAVRIKIKKERRAKEWLALPDAGGKGFEIGMVKTASDRKIELLNKKKHK
jgi:hypothetical protein